MKEFKLSTAKLKKAGKELQVILEPTEDDGVTPLIIADGTDDEMKTKIIEGGNALTTDDSISAHLTKVLSALNVTVSDEEETNENDTETEPKEVILTWGDINSMKKKELKKLCEEKKLITESDDYEKIKDFRIDVAVELGIEVPKEKVIEKVIEKEKVIEPEDNESLIEAVNNTKKLADLKELVENDDHFKKIRKGLKEYKGLSGPRKLKPKMLELLGVDVEKPVNKSGKEKAKAKSETENKEVPKNNKPAKNTNKSRYGRLINSMVGIIDGLIFDGVTEDKVIKEIQKKYPDKEDDKIISRFNVHINQLKKEGITINKKGKKYTSEEETHPNIKNMYGKK